MTQKFKFNNGQKVRDLVSGITGIINGSCVWLNGCVQYSVQPQSNDNKKLDYWWLDEQQVELIDEGISKKITPTPTGGPSTKSPR